MNKDIKVSVACITYNQENTVELMIKNIINQKTTFDFEVIIHDDCSTDGTARIIRKYADLYPDIIIPVNEKENQFSKGKKIFINCVVPLIRGKYVAFCEGDDYWKDEYKLQKQFEALENNQNCSFCVHDVACVNNSGLPLSDAFPGIDIKEGVIKASDYLEYEFVEKPWLFQTTSYFVRTSVIEKLRFEIPIFVIKYPVGDLPIVLLCLQEGNCYYIKQVMSVYRKNSGGILTQNRRKLSNEIKYYERMIEGHKEYKKYAKEDYKKYAEYAISTTKVFLLKLKGEYRAIDKKDYLYAKKSLSYKNRVMITIGKICPRVTYYCYKLVRNII